MRDFCTCVNFEKMKRKQSNLHDARLQAYEEFVNLARIYSLRAKHDPNIRIAFSEMEQFLQEQAEKIATKPSVNETAKLSA